MFFADLNRFKPFLSKFKLLTAKIADQKYGFLIKDSLFKIEENKNVWIAVNRHPNGAIHEKYPHTPIILAADAVNGFIVIPTFVPGEQSLNPKQFSDFNDLANRSKLGIEGVLNLKLIKSLDAIIACA